LDEGWEGYLAKNFLKKEGFSQRKEGEEIPAKEGFPNLDKLGRGRVILFY